jgi:hypothetical protein
MGKRYAVRGDPGGKGGPAPGPTPGASGKGPPVPLGGNPPPSANGLGGPPCGNGPMFGKDLYFISILGTPSEKSPWLFGSGIAYYQESAQRYQPILWRIPAHFDGRPVMEFQTSFSRRQFLSTIAVTSGAAMTLRQRFGWAADLTDPRVANLISAKTWETRHGRVYAVDHDSRVYGFGLRGH